MVFFVCEGCNETLKKNKVNAHVGRCRNFSAVSCVDCSVVFEGNEYAAHTSCISEAEKYEKSLYHSDKKSHKMNGSTKQMTPQERWMNIVRSATCLDDCKVQDVLTRLATYDNVPRKKNKFINFVSNSLALHDMTLVEKAWTMYEMAFNTSVSEKIEQNAISRVAVEENNHNKRLGETVNDDTVVRKKTKTEDRPIKWSKIVKSTLKRFGKELEMEMLQNHVLKQIQEKKLSMKNEKELKKEFKASIRKNEKVEVIEVVRLQ
ncbi:unnamed protein product [Peronospora belbahrii]|uniref:Zinc finger C2H2 LYAR-type domain-containing protein n=1 Tax=Peronospora belbahrii TaxID=622444 RepID=A0AAU9L0R5_9STRA|nr:unnamed protein product [Peronospora belbahrii]CAH0518701.1 unnamed protein product [Peronospora belbahrii]